MGVLNAVSRFRDSARKTNNYKKTPASVREAFSIHEVSKDGIFKVEATGKESGVFDACFTFSNINYINKDDDEKTAILLQMMKWLNFMSIDFKITVMNTYRDTEKYINDIMHTPNADAYSPVKGSLDEWVRQKVSEGKIKDNRQDMYLTIVVRSSNRDEAKSYISNTAMQVERMFGSFGSSVKRLDGEGRLNILKDFFYPEDVENGIGYVFDKGRKEPLSSVLPTSIEQEKNWMVLGETCASVLFAREYASSLDEGNVVNGFASLPFVSIFTLDYAPVQKRTLSDMLDAAHLNNEKAIAQEEEARRKKGSYMVGVSYQKEKQKEELEKYKTQIESNSETAFLVSMYCVVTAHDDETLAKYINSLKLIARENGVFLDTCNFTQLKSLNTAMPIGTRSIKYPRSFLTSSLVSLQPFYAQELEEEGGFFYGLNRTTKHLVFGNRKKLASPHGMIVGHTGSGKSFFIKETEISQTLIGTDDDLMVIDPQNEMRGICEVFGGQFIDMAPKADFFINPLEVPEGILKSNNTVEKAQFTAEQTSWLTSFCAAAMRNIVLTEEHYSILGRSLRTIYAEIFEKKAVNEQPTLFSVRTLLKKYMDEAENAADKEVARVLYNSLEEYTEGAFDLFAYPSTVDIHKRFVVFGLAEVPSQLWEPVMITIMHFLSNRMEYNKQYQRPTRLIIDETQEVCRNEASAAMLMHAVVTYRKFGGIVTMALQNLTRALENPDLRDMFSNCGYKYFLDQGGVDAASLAEIQELSTAEFGSLSENRPGFGLLVWGKKIIMLDSSMEKTNSLYDVFSTNFHEKAARQRMGEDNKQCST